MLKYENFHPALLTTIPVAKQNTQNCFGSKAMGGFYESSFDHSRNSHKPLLELLSTRFSSYNSDHRVYQNSNDDPYYS